MTFAVRRCDSFSSDDLTLKGFEIVVEIGPLGLQLFIGRRK